MLPNFMVVGTQRGGTSWLHHSLSEHPEVFTSIPKELSFFHSEEKWNRGLPWYESFFDEVGAAKALGEATPEYMFDPVALDRIARVLPHVRLIAVLRDPVARAYSAYWLFRNRLYRGISFEEALERGTDGLLERGLYADQIERMHALFEPERLLVLISEEMRADNSRALRNVCEFLDVDPDFQPSTLGRSHNAVIYPGAQDTLRRMGLGWTIALAKRTWLGDKIRARSRESSKPGYPPMADATRARLRDYFREPNRRLEALLGRTPGWE